MSSDIYKVIFKGSKDFKVKKLTLTFKRIVSDEIIKIPEQFFLDLKNRSDSNNNLTVFQNIKEVSIVGKSLIKGDFKSYYALLFTPKSNKKKEGFLFGNLRKLENILIGIWYFNKQATKTVNQNINEKLQDLSENLSKYSNITLIY